MSRRKVEVRREEILDATVEQVQQRGFGSTRVGDVAQALGISSGLVFYHFGTKDKLFAAALEHAADRDLARLERTVARATNPLDAVRRVLALYSPQGNAPGWAIWVDAWAESLWSQDMRTASRALDVRWKDVLAGAIRAGVAEGCFHCEDPDGAAWRLSAPARRACRAGDRPPQPDQAPARRLGARLRGARARDRPEPARLSAPRAARHTIQWTS